MTVTDWVLADWLTDGLIDLLTDELINASTDRRTN